MFILHSRLAVAPFAPKASPCKRAGDPVKEIPKITRLPRPSQKFVPGHKCLDWGDDCQFGEACEPEDASCYLRRCLGRLHTSYKRWFALSLGGKPLICTGQNPKTRISGISRADRVLQAHAYVFRKFKRVPSIAKRYVNQQLNGCCNRIDYHLNQMFWNTTAYDAISFVRGAEQQGTHTY